MILQCSTTFRGGHFHFRSPAGNGQNKKLCQGIGIDGHVPRGFTRLVKTVVSTYWTAVQDENYQYPAVSVRIAVPNAETI